MFKLIFMMFSKKKINIYDIFFNDMNTFGNIKLLLYYICMIREGAKLRVKTTNGLPPSTK